MGKSISPIELYLWFDIGLEPRHVIRLGYSSSSVYKHYNRYRIAKAKLLEQVMNLVKKNEDTP